MIPKASALNISFLKIRNKAHLIELGHLYVRLSKIRSLWCEDFCCNSFCYVVRSWVKVIQISLVSVSF